MSTAVEGPNSRPNVGGGPAQNDVDSISSYTVKLNQNRLEALRAAGYSDRQIEALLALADPNDETNSLEPTHFQSFNKETLNALKYRGKLNEATRQLIYLQAPVAMVQEVSDPNNWSGDRYLGSGSATVTAIMTGQEVDLTQPSLDALMLSVLTARSDILQAQLQDQIKVIQERNELLEEGNAALARARGEKALTYGRHRWWDDTFRTVWRKLGAPIHNINQEGITGPHNGFAQNASDWDINISNLKGAIEELTSESQLDTTRLQQTINKYNQTFELLSNFINRYFQSLGSVIQNLR